MIDYDRHVRRGHPITFGLIILFAIIELCISAWLTARFNQHHNYLSTSVRDRTRFLLFASAWTIVGSVLFIIVFLSAAGSFLASVGSHAVFMFMTWVFWLSGSAAITQALSGSLNCSRDHIVYCGQLNALEAFGWIEWVMTTFALVVIIFCGVSATRRGDGLRGQLVSV